MSIAATAMGNLADDLREIVGDLGLLTGADVRARSCDPLRNVPPQGDLIVRPATAQELSKILSLCHSRGQTVVTHGGRSGIAGGAYAGADDLIISLERLNRVEEIDPVNQVAVVQGGVTLEALQMQVAKQGLLYPIDLGAKGTATIGGTIATNAGGNRVLRWGMTRQNLLGLEVVLADGTIVSSMNRLIKNNSGYDLKQYFVGSEGTLGIVTRAVLKLVPAPTSHSAVFVSSPSYGQLLDLLARARRLPCLSAFEVMWRDFYEIVARDLGPRRPVAPDEPYYALIEMMGYDELTDSQLFSRFIENGYETGLVGDAVLARSGREIAEFWAIREVPESILRALRPALAFDISVDVRRAEVFVQTVRATLGKRYDVLRSVAFGHLGDNNIHLGVHVGPQTLQEELNIERLIYGIVKEFGGALTAEHGVGRLKREFLPEHRSSAEMATMRRIRDALDPDRLLNREVLF